MMIEFLKMHGLGNDFIVFDARASSALADMRLDEDAARLIADRRFGIGCDQIMILRDAKGEGDLYLDMRNQDGSETGACGNGTRCVAHLVMAQTGKTEVSIETKAGLLQARQKGDLIEVNRGQAYLKWDEIPLREPVDTCAIDLAPHEDITAVGVSLGNPHAVLFVEDAEVVDVATRGAALEWSAPFPEGVNVSFAHMMGPNKIRMRVFERGVGITSACGSGACAVGVAAHRRGLAGRSAEVVLDGGSLFINWQEDGTVLMAGPVATSYQGVLSGALEASFHAAQKAPIS